jgi:hypothetical protein
MRRLLAAAVLATLCVPAVAQARLAGETTVSLTTRTQRSLVDQGVTIEAVRPTSTNGVSVVFPRSGRHWRGGLKLAARSRVTVLRRLHTRGSLLLGFADGRRLAFARRSGRVLHLTRRGARLLNQVAGAKVVKPGSAFGSVSSSLCRRPPCGRTRLGGFTPLLTGTVGFEDMVTEARALGIGTLRFSQTLGAPARPAFSLFERDGIAAVPTIRNDPQPDGQGNNPAHPPATPEALAAFRSQLGELLDGVPHPALLMVENEEVAPRFFAGTMAQYVQELNAATDVAHARGIRVTNGGITNELVKLLVWQDYKDRGLDALAYDFAGRAFAVHPNVVRALRAQPFAGLPIPALQAAWDRTEELIPAFRKSAMDYVDFHWYTDDDQVLAEVVDYLRRATGKPVVTTEIGQHNTSSDVVTGHLTTLVEELRLPFVIWFDADGIPARGLHDNIGQLRPNGQAFKDFVASHGELLR